MWALVQSFWIILNPDQRWLVYHDLNDDSIDSLLEKERLPSPSIGYERIQATQLAKLRDVYYFCFSYNQEQRKSTEEISILLEAKFSLEIHNLENSQASALEQSDQEVAKCLNNDNNSIYTGQPPNDGSNSYAFLSLGIIDKLSNCYLSQLTIIELQSKIQDVISKYHLLFNRYHDFCLYAVDEAYNLLISNYCLIHHMFMKENYTDKRIFTCDCQKHFYNIICGLIYKATTENKSKFDIYQANIYIFSMAITPNGVVFAFETHPIPESCGHDGNGVVVESNDVTMMIEWVNNRLTASNVSESSFACVIELDTLFIKFHVEVAEKTEDAEDLDDTDDADEIQISNSESDLNDEEEENDEKNAIEQRLGFMSKTEVTANVFTKHAWNGLKSEKVNCLPFDTDGLVHYELEHQDRAKLLHSCTDRYKEKMEWI